MLAVMIVPTGIGCEIGGHAGDATPAARLLAAACDTLILHPNVVNASDINEAPANSLYVEGGLLDRFLAGDSGLERVISNRVLVAVNAPVLPQTVNAVSAARATLGLEASVIELKTPLVLKGWIGEDGAATGSTEGIPELYQQLAPHFREYDALAITTPITVDYDTTTRYLEDAGVNPWGGVEAMLSRKVGKRLMKPVAHAPSIDAADDFDKICDPRMAAEMVSFCFLHCVLKGLHRAPREVRGRTDIRREDVACLISPAGCYGHPHAVCEAWDIPVIVVRENKTVQNEPEREGFIYVENYHEAAGLMLCMRQGIAPASVRRPLRQTVIHGGQNA